MKIISEAAMISRIRRCLKNENERLCIPRGERTWGDLGIHTVDLHTNVVTAYHCSIAGLARDLELLRDGEQLEAQ